MQTEKICCNVPSETLGSSNELDYLGSKDSLQSLSNTIVELNKKINSSTYNFAKLYFDNEAVISLSKMAINNSFSEIYEVYKKILFKTYDFEPLTKSLLNAVKIAGEFTINTHEWFATQEKILKLYEPIKIDTYGLEEMFSELRQRLNEMVQAIPDEDYNVLFKDTEYTKSDVLDELDVFVQTDINSTNEYSLIWQDDNLSLKQKKDKILEVFYTKHPAIYMMVFICSMLCAIYGCKEMGENFLLPMFENAIVALEGNQDIYFVDVEDGARLYQYADTKSDVVMHIDFTEQVEVIDEIKFWSQVIYLDEEGNEIIGWIAKRNLVSYKDWKYEADKMYSDVE